MEPAPLRTPAGRRAEPAAARGRTYLDAASVAPLHPLAREALLAALDEGWADPRRLHREGRQARMLLDGARAAIAAVLGARPEEVTLTGSHVGAVHAGVLGALHGGRRRGGRAVVSQVEHSSVLHAAARGATEVTRVSVDRLGRVDAERFAHAVQAPGVSLACLQSANGEVGTTQPVEVIADAARRAGVPLLVDAGSSTGHGPPPPAWDLLTADAQAWGGPPGTGVLAVRAGVRWVHAGPEHDGVEKVADGASIPAALAAAVALEAVEAGREAEGRRRAALVDGVRACANAVRDTEVVGDPVDRLPHIVTFSCLFADGETVVEELDRAGFAVGSGSACTAATLRPSHVLEAMGVLTHGNVRVGLPTGITAGQVEAFCAVLPGAVARVRELLGADDL